MELLPLRGFSNKRIVEWFYCNEDAREENWNNMKSILPILFDISLFRKVRSFGMVLNKDR